MPLEQSIPLVEARIHPDQKPILVVTTATEQMTPAEHEIQSATQGEHVDCGAVKMVKYLRRGVIQTPNTIFEQQE